MNNPIFNRSDFTLCEVPVPKGYPQSQTHAGIAYWGGKFYMTTSPFPNKKLGKLEFYIRIIVRKLSRGFLLNPVRADYYENPCIYVGEERGEHFPTKFRLLSQHPLMECPDDYYGYPSYNSDPDLYVEDGTAYILNRSVFPTSNDYSDPNNPYPAIVRIFMIKGKFIDDKFVYESTNLIKEWNKPYASPCMTKYNGKYVLTFIDTNSANDGETFNGIFVGQAANPDDFARTMEFKKVHFGEDSKVLPWHMSLFHFNNKLYTVIACVEKGKKEKIWQMLGEFNDDLSELKIFPHPLTDYNSYRGSASVDDRGVFVLYTTTVHEKIKGSKAVDGRNILMASMPFTDLLREIQKN